MPYRSKALPKKLQRLCNSLVASFMDGNPVLDGIEKMQDWLETEGWDMLIGEVGNHVFDIESIAQVQFNDGELRARRGLADAVILTDVDRARWARAFLKDLLLESDEWSIYDLHTYQLLASNGLTACIGCVVELQGQLGPVVRWYGLYKDRDAFFNELEKNGFYWVNPKIEAITDQRILFYWKK